MEYSRFLDCLAADFTRLRAVESGPGDGPGDGTAAVLRWLWNREKAGEPSGVTVEGALDAVEELRGCIVVATQ